jgi:ribonuclease E
VVEPVEEDKPKTRRRPRARKPDAAAPAVKTAQVDELPLGDAPAEISKEVAPAAPKRRSRAKKAVPAADDVSAPATVAEPQEAIAKRSASQEALAETSAPQDAGPQSDQQASNEDGGGEEASDGSGARRGWWQRTFG